MTNDQEQTTNRIHELLSPYLDGAVTADERAQIENALAQSPELRAELDSLRQTVQLMHSLPRVPAPRPFTLSADVAGIVPSKPPKRNWLKWVTSGVSAVVAIAVVLMVGVTLFNQNQLGKSDVASVAMAPQMAEENTPAKNSAPDESLMAETFAAPESTAMEEPTAETVPAVAMMKSAETQPARSAPTEGNLPPQNGGAMLESAPVEMPAEVETESMADAVAPMADTVAACDVLPSDDFIEIWQNNPEIQNGLGCPTDPHPRIEPDAYTVKTAVQLFEHGTMIWSDRVAWYPQPVIYVIQSDGSFARFDDNFDAENDAVAGDDLPPDGRVAPILGFGKIWRTEMGMRDSLGWAIEPEQSGEGVFQMFEGGDMLWLSQDNRTYVFLHAENRVEIFDNPDLNN